MAEPDRGAEALGAFIRAQRQLAQLSVRQLAEMAAVSNPYLSQIERGLYKPSAEILKSLAAALGISSKALYEQAGLLDEEADTAESARPAGGVEEAIRLDPRLSSTQKKALLGVYRGFVGDA